MWNFLNYHGHRKIFKFHDLRSHHYSRLQCRRGKIQATLKVSEALDLFRVWCGKYKVRFNSSSLQRLCCQLLAIRGCTRNLPWYYFRAIPLLRSSLKPLLNYVPSQKSLHGETASSTIKVLLIMNSLSFGTSDWNLDFIRNKI